MKMDMTNSISMPRLLRIRKEAVREPSTTNRRLDYDLAGKLSSELWIKRHVSLYIRPSWHLVLLMHLRRNLPYRSPAGTLLDPVLYLFKPVGRGKSGQDKPLSSHSAAVLEQSREKLKHVTRSGVSKSTHERRSEIVPIRNSVLHA